jgi:DNA ligase-1
MQTGERFVFNKLITGGFRVGASQGIVVRALAEVAGVDAAVMSHRLMGDWKPTPEFFANLLAPDRGAEDTSRPYPFFLAHPLEGAVEELGDVADWQVEWKWDGIRAQLIRRGGRSFLWSRGEELVTERYPELERAAERLPDGTALDGEILPHRLGVIGPFSDLQKRIGRKSLTKRILEQTPVLMTVYDLLERAGEDWRAQPLARRRRELVQLLQELQAPELVASPVVEGADWRRLAALRQESRERNVEGLMLKRLDSPYRVGRVRGDWWKWKVDPFTVDAVLIAAQPGSGKRASLFTDYTFGVWDGGALVAFAKAYSGLSDEEIRRVDAFVRKNTLEKYGPVRSVRPMLVFELGFEAIQRSPRHRSGVAVRFPRMLRWREDKPAEQADSLDSLRALLPPAPEKPARKKRDAGDLPLFRDLD